MSRFDSGSSSYEEHSVEKQFGSELPILVLLVLLLVPPTATEEGQSRS